MNLRQVWTELFQKPTGRLLLFLLVGGIFLAFVLLRRGSQPKPDNTTAAKPATQTKAYSFNEDISPPSRAQATPLERVSDKTDRATPTPKPPPAIPQTIFAIKEQPISEFFLPYGRMLRCELVNTGLDQHRHAHNWLGHRGRLDPRATHYPGGHGSPWPRPEIGGSRKDRL